MALRVDSQVSKVTLPISCGNCGKTDEKLSRCARCYLQMYCGKECQIAHWPQHKKVCQKIKTPLWDTIQQQSKEWLARKKSGASDSNNGALFATMNERVFPALEDSFQSNGEGKVAFDLGCGNGTTTLYLLEKKWKVISIDFNEKAISLLIDKANASNKEWIKNKQLVTQVANIEDYIFSEKAHLIVVNDVFPYCNPEKIRHLWEKIYVNLEDNGHIADTFFEQGGKSHQVWASFGAWFVDNKKFVEDLLSASNYTTQMCRYRPKEGGSSVIEFVAQKPAQPKHP
jgi:SAM-dependent methyltransferase